MRRFFLIFLAGFFGCAVTPMTNDFHARDLSGSPKSFSELRGAVTVLAFGASWCSSCREELQALQNIYEAGKNSGLQVVAVTLDDSPEDMKEFVQEKNISFPVLFDASEAKALYRVTELPRTFVLDSCGKTTEFFDPESKELVISVTGFREWDTPSVYRNLLSIRSKPC